MHSSSRCPALSRVAVIAVIAIALLWAATAADAGQPKAFKVEDGIETARFMDDHRSGSIPDPGSPASVSPDGRTFLLRIVRGDVRRNGLRMELWRGGLDSIESASALKRVARFFSTGLPDTYAPAGPDMDSVEAASPLRWIDNDHVAFLWSDSTGKRQVVSVDIRRKDVKFLTAHPRSIVAFDINSSGRLIYIAGSESAPRLARRDDTQGDPVPDDFEPSTVLTGGDIHGPSVLDRMWNTEAFVKWPGQPPRRLHFERRAVDITEPFSRLLKLSPSGRFALIGASPPVVPEDWAKYTDRLAQQAFRSARHGRRTQMARFLQHTYVVDLRTGEARILWNAMTRGEAEWSPDETQVLFTATFLPPEEESARGLEGRAAAIVDVASGRFEELPLEVETVISSRWLSRDEIRVNVIDPETRQLAAKRLHRAPDGWELVLDPDDVSGDARLQLREALNEPPRLYAIDTRSKREALVCDPNPGLMSKFALGKAERRSGVSRLGRRWDARLIYPPRYVPGQRYPLVIQSSYSGLGSPFNLYGASASVAGLGPTPVAPYPGQALASRDIVVLQLDAHATTGASEAETYRAAFEDAIDHLDEEGLIDRSKVGLLGFSRNGYYVEHALVHSSVRFAAAVVTDHFNPGYFATALFDWHEPAIEVIGAAPFGEALAEWLAKAPAFNAEKVQTPLRIIGQSLGSSLNVLSQWELFSRLRYLRKPVEFYLMPGIDRHGGHNTQNPAQIIALQQGVIDWFDFWLNGREDDQPARREQYARWRALRERAPGS